MNSVRSKNADPKQKLVRCAIYTRKSTDEGLEKEFNSLDAQRDSGEAYIVSQQSLGWTCLPDRYDDGGFTGGNMDRPALKRLMADIADGKIDCVLVYKVDRLSRSLIDFTRIMESFDQAGVSFVSVTQQFNTTSSMGRLTLNILLSFAQFEREIISERTRDKIAAARRKGKWSGGMPLLGYGVDPRGAKLVIDEVEADRVRAIFELYLEHHSMIQVIDLLDKRGWFNKHWTTHKGTIRGGKQFTKSSLHRLLTNVTYIGKLRYKDEVHEGEQEAIVDLDIWRRVQTLLSKNGRTGGIGNRNKFGALLKGILRCDACDCAMTPAHSTKNGNKRYRYYVCNNAQKRGWNKCPSKSVPAEEMERFVVDQIRCIGRDPSLVREVVAQSQNEVNSQLASLLREKRSVERDIHHWHSELDAFPAKLKTASTDSELIARSVELRERIQSAEFRIEEIDSQQRSLAISTIDELEASQSLSKFDPTWDSLTPSEQSHIIRLLIEEVSYNGATGKLSISFHACGIAALTEELNKQEQLHDE